MNDKNNFEDVGVFQVPLKLNESKTYKCREVLEILIPVGIQSQWLLIFKCCFFPLLANGMELMTNQFFYQQGLLLSHNDLRVAMAFMSLFIQAVCPEA